MEVILLTIFGLLSSILILYRPWYGILILIFLMLFLNASTEEITLYEKIYILIFFLTVFAWIIKHLYLKSRLTIFEPGLSLPILLFFIINVFSIFPAMQNNVEIWEWLRGWYRFAPLFLFFIIVTEIKKYKQLKILIILYLIVSAGIALQGIVYFVRMGNFSIEKFFVFRSLLLKYNSCLFFYGLIIAISLFVFCKKKSMKLFLYIIIIICLLRTLLHGGRTMLILFIWALFIISLLRGLSIRKTFIGRVAPLIKYGTILSILIFVFFYTISSFAQFYESRFSKEIMLRGLYIRLDDWNSAWSYIKQKPLLGYGHGYKFERTGLMAEKYFGNIGTLYSSFVHSTLLFLFLHTGIMGVIVFYYLIYKGIKEGIKVFYLIRDSFLKGLIGGIICFLILFGIISLISGIFARLDINFSIGIFLASIVIVKNFLRQNSELTKSKVKFKNIETFSWRV